MPGVLWGKNVLCENTWKQESYGMYVAEFPDSAVFQWSVHSCLLRDSRRGSYLLCVLMGQIYKRKSLLSKKLAFLREGGWIQISVKWNLEIHMWAENASPQPLGVRVCVQRGPEPPGVPVRISECVQIGIQGRAQFFWGPLRTPARCFRELNWRVMKSKLGLVVRASSEEGLSV